MGSLSVSAYGVPGPEGGPGGVSRCEVLYFPDVGCLKTLWAARHFELDPVTFGQALEALSLDGAVVHEDILAALLSDESIPFRVVEPLHLSLSHTSNLSLGGLQAPCSRHRGGVAFRNWKANKKAPRTVPSPWPASGSRSRYGSRTVS